MASDSIFTADQVKTYVEQVYIPTSYHTAADASLLGTMYLGYIPSDQVDTLAGLIKATKSAFYTGVQDPVAQALAARVASGFALNSVADPNASTKSGSTTSSSASSSNGKTRQDAIIGVVSALGAIALLVLLFLVYRSYKRRQELAHRRLSEPIQDAGEIAGARPDGRDFDQDSVGGQRRRSFYFAEDSLRGFGGDRPEENVYDSRVSPTNMRQRPVIPGAISAPILQQSSMNW